MTDAADGRFVSNEFPTFDVDIASAEPHYLALLLRSPRVWAELSELITGVGARRERLPVDEFLAYQVPLPALAVQREVVAKAHLPAALAIRQAAECAATRSLAASMLSGILDGAGGRVVQLGEIAELALDKVDVERHGAYPIAGVKIAGAGLFSREVLSGANTSYSKLTKLSAGQLVYRKLTAWEGPITVVSEPFDGYFVSPEFPTFKLDLEQVDADVLRLICRSPLFHAEMKSLATGTAERRNRLKPEDLLDIEIELPRLTHQAPIGMICRLADALETEAEHAATLSRAVAVGVVRELLQG